MGLASAQGLGRRVRRQILDRRHNLLAMAERTHADLLQLGRGQARQNLAMTRLS